MKFTDFLNEGPLNEKSFVPMTDETNDLGKYIVEALNTTSQFHIFHWLSKTGQKHVTLGEFYNSLQGEVDGLAEIFISIGGSLQMPENSIFVAYSDDLVRSALQSLRDRTSICIDKLNSSNFKSLQDSLIDIQELIDKTVYKFDLE